MHTRIINIEGRQLEITTFSVKYRRYYPFALASIEEAFKYKEDGKHRYEEDSNVKRKKCRYN